MRGTSATGSRVDAAQGALTIRATFPCRGGYTLLELMVVLAILGLMAGLFPLALNRALPARRVAATAQHVVAWISEVQAESVATGHPLAVSLEEHGLRVQSSTGVVHLAPLAWSDSTLVTLRTLDGTPKRRFGVYPDGSTDGADLNLLDGTHHAHIRVSALTGRVKTEAML